LKQQREKEEAKKHPQPNKPNKPVDPDPNGEKLVSVADPLAEAHKYLKQLLKFSDNSLETHLVGYQVALHRKKYLLALRSVIKGVAMAPHDPEVHTAVVKFFHTVSTATLHPNVQTVISLETENLLGGKTVVQYNDAYLAAHGQTVAARRAHFECALLFGAQKEKLLPHLVATDDTGFQLEECIKVHKILIKEFGEKVAEDYKKQCQGIFPYARYFSDKKEEVEIKKEPEQDTEDDKQ